MPFLTIKIPYEKRRDGVYADVGPDRFYADSKQELTAKVAQVVDASMGFDPVDVVRCSDAEVKVVQKHGDQFRTTKFQRHDAGPMREICTGLASAQGDTLNDEMERELYQLAMQQWHEGDDDDPEFLPERFREEFAAWKRFQIAYRIAKDSGVREPECHRLACDAMS